MIIKYVRMFLAFILPILGKTVLTVAADELARVAYPPTSRNRYPAYRRYDSVRTARRIPPTPMPGTVNYNRQEQGLAENPGFHDTLLVAFDVFGPSAEVVHDWLQLRMPAADRLYSDPEGNRIRLDSWWVANDERFDRSDCDSAVFVEKGKQVEARNYLRMRGLSS